VISVDWESLAAPIDYIAARLNARPVGEYLGEMYAYLTELGLSLDATHCIGKSLGAHVCGFSGKAVLNETQVSICGALRRRCCCWVRRLGFRPSRPSIFAQPTRALVREANADFACLRITPLYLVGRAACL
jgi:Lipase